MRSLIAELTAGGGPALPPAEGRLAERQIAGLQKDFRAHMDEDLSVGRAVDAIHARLRALRRSHGRLPAGLARRLRAELASIDEVLGFLL